MKTLATRIALLAAIGMSAPAVVGAQETGAPDAASTSGTPADPASDAGDTGDAAVDAGDEAAEEALEVNEDLEDVKESSHGSYEWKPSFGGGIEYGLFFTKLDRWNAYILDPAVAERIDIKTLWHLDLALEASVLEGTRFTIFGGLQRPFDNSPKVQAAYIGIEPAFAFRRDFWELALGLGAGIGRASLEVDEGTMKAGLVTLRPFLELRRYLGTFMAVYGRFGFSQWLVNNPELDGDLEFAFADTSLDEGGPYLALGLRFGHYPEHVKEVGDKDGDGFRDDVDACPEEPEDVDGFEDDDGCPELDNDQDGINDDVDKCPLKPEDLDGFEDEDGCPESDDDSDGDGILNDVDKCPNDPEDFDGYQDKDGCPDLDNDGDGILDKDDKCPLKPGVKVKQGCPYELVEVTADKIVIKDKIFFEFDKAVIKPESFDLLDQVVGTLKAFPRIKKVEIQGHTDHAGKEDYNLKLSDDRAKSVYTYLVEKGGVDPARLTSKGYGESQPLIPLGEDGKETEEEAAKNRRVEFVIIEQDEVKQVIREDKLQESSGKEVIEKGKINPARVDGKPDEAEPTGEVDTEPETDEPGEAKDTPKVEDGDSE